MHSKTIEYQALMQDLNHLIENEKKQKLNILQKKQKWQEEKDE